MLSGESTEDVVESIHEYLTTISQNIRAGQIKIDDFIINKVRLPLPLDYALVSSASFQRLGKNPEDYPDAKSQPHVQVALRLKAKGTSARIGSVIPYIFCIGEGEESAKSAQADRAKHPDEIRRSEGQLKIGGSHP